MYRTNERVQQDVFAKIPNFENRKFLSAICSRNQQFTPILTAEYLNIAKRKGFVEANIRLRGLDDRLKLGGTGLRASADDEEISSYADQISKRLAMECDGWTARAGVLEAVRWARSECERTGVGFPAGEDAEPGELVAAMARVFDAVWWRRQLRTMQARKIEDVARDVRRVALDREPYASNLTVTRRTKQRRRNAETLARMEAENEEGQVFALSDLMERSLANPVHRRAELMTRIRGFEEVAGMCGHVGVFITLTAPSKYHRMMTKNGRSFANPKWDGSNPRAAQEYHLQVWESVRAEWHREAIRPYGFRVVEPNHDGTPHWHLLLFIEPEKLADLKLIITRLALVVDGDEKGALKHRVTIKTMDPENGTAAGYIAKYISKNIDGFGIEGEHAQPGEDAPENARRIEAWAATYRLRQFQQIGGPSVGVWRELRRLDKEQPWMRTAAPAVLRAYEEAKAANWAAYCLVMGGPQVKREEMPLQVEYRLSETRYHEEGRKVVGVAAYFVLRSEDGKKVDARVPLGTTLTRLHTWTVQRLGESQRKAERLEIHRVSNADLYLDLSEEFGVPWRAVVSDAGTASPWTCVNNYNSG